MSIRVLHCHITWRYWLWKTREGEDIHYSHVSGEGLEKSNPNQNEDLPCRVHVFLEGVEWFIYNRTPSYDAMVEKFGVPDVLSPELAAKTPDEVPQSAILSPTYPPTPAFSSPKSASLSGENTIWNRLRKAVWRLRMPEVDFNEILPVGLVIRKGALTIGNDSTPSILIMDLAGGNGTYGVSQSRCNLDEYKVMYDIQFDKVKIITRANPDYSGRMLDRGKDIHEHISARSSNNAVSSSSYLFEAFHELAHRLNLMPTPPLFSNFSAQPQRQKKWGGLARYHADNDSEEKAGVLHEPEYAKVTCLLDTPALGVVYYADVAGKVPSRPKPAPMDHVDIGNGDVAPEWGVELELHGGPAFITYGPWADRQRLHWQQMLTPPTYQNTQPSVMLKPGDVRQSVSLRVSVRFRDVTKLRVPTREPSKDWRYDGFGDLDAQRRRHRPYGWLDLQFEADSFLKYDMPMVASRKGFQANLEVDLRKITASSSVNQVEFLRADRCVVRGTMPNPHIWNAERVWRIETTLTKPIIKLLRDHINLLTDLTKDWTSSSPSDTPDELRRSSVEEYERFVPIVYDLKVVLENYRLDLYANDHNIIDWPLSHVDNSILSLTGQTLATDLSVLSNEFRPEFSSTPFKVAAPHVNLAITMPKWNTHSAFSTPRTSSIGRIELLAITGLYTSYSDIRPDAVDRLRLDIEASGVVFKAFGWAVRHLMVIKENYFGMFTNFTTRNEFLNKLHEQSIGDPVRGKYREGKSNPFEVDLGVLVSDSLLALPQEVYDCQAGVVLEISDLQLMLRLHAYAMEMSLNVGPVPLVVLGDLSSALNHGRIGDSKSGDRLSLQGLDIVANRLFGPEPEVATYLCLWEILPAELSGSLSIASVVGLQAAIRAFQINFSDDFNAPSTDFTPPTDPDVTFLRVKCPLVDVAIGVGENACINQASTNDSLLHFSLSKGFSVQLTNRPNQAYASCMRFDVPVIIVRIIQRITGFHQTWFELASISFDLAGEKTNAPLGWREHVEEQLNFLRMQDATTRRAAFLYEPGLPPIEVPRHGGLTYLTPLRLPDGFGNQRSSAGSVLGSTFERKEYEDSFRSEQDDVMTEASRDARVASSRPVTPQVAPGRYTPVLKFRTQAPDGDMSSGDESDNNSTEYEPSLSSSIVPPGDDDSIEATSWPHVDHYRQALKRYRPIQSGYNTAYETYCLKHDPTKSFDTQAEELAEKPHSQPKKREPQDHENTETFKVTVQRHLNVVVTPTCIPFVCDMLTEFDTHSHKLDLVADTILDEFLGTTSNQNQVSRNSLIVEVPLVKIHFLQSIMSSTEADALSTGTQHHSAVPVHVDARVLALFDVQIHQATCRLEILTAAPAHHTTVVVEAVLVDSRLRTLVNKPFAHSRYEIEPSSDKMRFKVTGAKLDLSSQDPAYAGSLACDDFNMFVSNKSPEILMTTIAASNYSLSRISSFLESRSELLSRRRRYFLWAAISRLQGQSVAPDPFATNLPSFLVQTGRPGRLRSDPSWKTLTIIRQSVRQMGLIDKNLLQSNLTGQTNELSNKQLDELLALMDAQWTDLYGQDENGLLRIPPILRNQFPSNAASTPPLHFQAVISISCPHAKIILQSHGSDYNELMANDLKLGLRASIMNYAPIKNDLTESGVDASTKKALHVVGSASVRQINVSVYPSCVLFVRQVLRVQRQMNLAYVTTGTKEPPDLPYSLPFEHVVFEWALSASSIGFAAPAQQITFEANTYGCSANITAVVELPAAPAPPQGSLAATLAANRISIQASQGKSQKSSQSLLAGIDFRNVMVHGAMKETPGVLTKARLLLCLDKFRIHVPRSVLRLYKFIDSWRREYLPTYDSMFQDLLSELDRDSSPNNSPMFQPPLFSGEFKVNVQAQLREFSTELHVMHGTWLTWNVVNSITYIDSRGADALKFGHRIGSQVIHLTNGQPNGQRTVSGGTSVYLELPSLRLEGTYPHVNIHLHVDRFSVTLKPQYVDDFLAIQQKFGSDFNELVELAVEFRNQRGIPTTKPSDSASNAAFPRFDISFIFEGFRVGIEGPSSTQYLDSSSITGRVHSGSIKRWSFNVESLALSLAHHSAPRRTRSNFDRKYRSAYMVLDMTAENVEHPEITQEENHLGVTINFVHAVMQPAAIAELGDLIDHIQAEMLSRQEQRVQELEEVRRKTRQVMRTLESSDHPLAATQTKTFLDNRKIEFVVKDIGVAFPLTLQDDLMLPQMESSTITPLSPSSVPAFLISLSSISFVTQRYETGQAKLTSFSFQFVPGFDQSQPSHFSGNTHNPRNRMLYPLMEAYVRSEAAPGARQIWVRANVSGFEVDLEPSIAGYLFSIVDVYRQGRDRIAKLAAYAPRSDTASSTGSLAPIVTSSAQYSAVLTTNVKASFEFKSGRIRSHTPNVRASDPERSRSLPDFTSRGETFEHEVDTLDLPMVTAWLEYRATPASQKVLGSTSSNQSILVCNTTIHPISNVLRPSLLPFLADVFKRVQERLAQAPAPHQSPYIPAFSDLSTIHEGLSLDDAPHEDPPVIGSMQVIFSLDVNKSTLELTCQPDVNVVAGLNWEKGGFMITISPGAREVAVVGTLTSITAGIQHGYLNDDSISAKAQNLAFSVDFRKLKDSSSLVTNSVSVVINTEVGAEMRFSRLQDLLCFKAVWLDRIPVFDSLARPAPAQPTPAIIKAELPGGDYVAPTQPFQTLVLVNINKVNIIADLGQAISKTTLDIEGLAFRTKLCEEVSEATLTIARLELVSERSVVGFVRMPDFVFQTVRRRHGKLYHDQEGHSKMLELILKSGDIEAAMEYERQHLMHFHADPLYVTIFDDWSKVTPKIPINEREVLLEFNIQAGDILAYASTATIPKMITVGGKLAALIKAQKQGAARESNAFRASQMPKPDTALSEVAAAMLQSARSRFKETETFQFAIIQRLTLSIETLRLAVPPVTQQRSELALFSARKVNGELHRTIRPHEPPCRNLHLRLGAFSIRGVPQPNIPNMEMVAKEILDAFPYGTRLFLFPDTQISMQTTQRDHKVSYNFAINLADRLAGEKGIYVALSFASWNWLLGIKRKFETDLEAALAEAATSGKDTPPIRRRKTIDTDPGLSSAEEEGIRSVYHSPMMTPRSQTPTGSTPASPRGATMPITISGANVISVQPIRGSRGLEYEESTSQVSIDAPTLEVLGRATPDISNTPTFKGLKKALPTWVHEYTTLPIEEIMNVLLEVYSKQLRSTRSEDAAEGQ
ncbi:fermentation-like protein [Ceratobasidium sp. AG-Ba]|nr:fermentation-like protein [Ceratobasidium sp. AG-Ba]QRW08473.1 fermentation-like protein [Ceratobasidium sp. AG-Ba]